MLDKCLSLTFEVIKKILFNVPSLAKFLRSTFFTMLAYLVYKRFLVLVKHKNPKELVYKSTPSNTSLINAMSPLDYTPSFFIPNYIAQAAYSELLNVQQTYFKREYILNPFDNGVISLDWAKSYSYSYSNLINKSEYTRKESINIYTNTCNNKGNKNFNNTQAKFRKMSSINSASNISENNKDYLSKNYDKLLMIVHGLSGGSDQLYIRDIVDSFKNEYTVVVIHARGINDTPLNNPIMYHAGFTHDVKFAIEYIRDNYNFKYRFLIGISMGANLTYKLLANDRSFDNYLTGFINISNFFHQLSAYIVNNGSLVDTFLLKGKKENLIKHQQIVRCNKLLNIDKALNAKTIRDFDNEIICKIHGFEDTEDYYRKTESGPDIDKLKCIKTLILVAKDDPIVFLFPKDILKSNNSNYLNINI